MDEKNVKRHKTKTQIELEGNANRSQSDHSVKLDPQNQTHDAKKVALGPNTER